MPYLKHAILFPIPIVPCVHEPFSTHLLIFTVVHSQVIKSVSVGRPGLHSLLVLFKSFLPVAFSLELGACRQLMVRAA